MHSAEFVTAYPLDIDPEVIHAGEHSQLMLEGQEWSYRLGRLLYMVLVGRTPDTFTEPSDMLSYHLWSSGAIDDVIELVGYQTDAAHRAMNELNFSVMSHHMRSMWDLLLLGKGGGGFEAKRLHSIRASELALSKIGIVFNQAREQYAKRHGYEAWFDETGVSPLTPIINGILQEIDSAIVLLEIAKRHSSWVVLPAPLNFERMGRANNVDFVIVDFEQQNTIGVQVKTRVKAYQRERADPRRVVFIDGIKDLHNTRKLPTRYGRNKRDVVAWPGMIAVRLIANLPVNKNLQQVNRNMRRYAKLLSQEMPPTNLDQVIRTVEERLLAAMNLDA
jgi:hypothetical protein